MMKRAIGYILIIVGLILAVIFVWESYPKVYDYMHSRKVYDQIKEDYIISDDKQEETTFYQKEKLTEEDLALKKIPTITDTKKYACINVDGKGLKDENQDYAGWIYIPGTSISYPVVQSKDNTDYLHTNFKKEYNFPGTIFIDCRCEEGINGHHTILYGHNMRDGSMFAGIKKYSDEKFYKKHPVFWFITPERKMLYQIFSVVERSDPYDKKIFGVDGENISSDEEYTEMLDELKNRSCIKTEKKVGKDDFVMTLSTCTNDSAARYTIHGVLVDSVNNPSLAASRLEERGLYR